MASLAMKFDYTPGKIWCLVTQPDSCCFSLKLNESAKGQDLLDEVGSNCVLCMRSKSTIAQFNRIEHKISQSIMLFLMVIDHLPLPFLIFRSVPS